MQLLIVFLRVYILFFYFLFHDKKYLTVSLFKISMVDWCSLASQLIDQSLNYALPSVIDQFNMFTEDGKIYFFLKFPFLRSPVNHQY